MRLVWLPEAQADIQRLYSFLRERDPRAAERAIRAMQLGAQRLLEFPHMGRRMDDVAITDGHVLDGRRYTARVIVVDRVVDVASSTFGVRLELPNRDYRLPAGLKCRINLP
jgi:plasmid stabilization system protein ParE